MDTYLVEGVLHMVFNHDYDDYCDQCGSAVCYGYFRTERRQREVQAESAEVAPAVALKAIYEESSLASEIEDWHWHDYEQVNTRTFERTPSLVVRNLSEERRDRAKLEAWQAWAKGAA